MRRIVVDTSVIIKFFFPEKGSDNAIQLRQDHLERKITLYSRDLLLYEFTSALRNYTSVEISSNDFALASQTLASLKLQIIPLDYRELSELFLLSKKLSLSIYDCSYILLAKKLRAPLYTADRKLFQAGKTTVSLNYI